MNLDQAQQFANQSIEKNQPSEVNARALHFGQLGLEPQDLQQAKARLKQVSEHAVLNLGNDHTSIESGRSRKLGQTVGGRPLERDRLPGVEGTLDIVGHSSDGGRKIEGKSPQQLARLLKAEYGLTGLKTLNLVSCGSESFKSELQQALTQEGIHIENIHGATGRVAVNQLSGQLLDEALVGPLANIPGHDGALGRFTLAQGLPIHLDTPGVPYAPNTDVTPHLHLNKLCLFPASAGDFSSNLVKVALSHGRQSDLAELIGGIGIPETLTLEEARTEVLKTLNRPSRSLVRTQDANEVFCQYLEKVHGVNLGDLNDCLGHNRGNGSGHFGSLAIEGDEIKGRPAFARHTQSTVEIRSGQHRRHITAWHSLRQSMSTVLKAEPNRTAQDNLLNQFLNQAHPPQAVHDEALALANKELNPIVARLQDIPETQIDTKLKATLFIMNSNTQNLWPGDGKENSAINNAWQNIMPILSGTKSYAEIAQSLVHKPSTSALYQNAQTVTHRALDESLREVLHGSLQEHFPNFNNNFTSHRELDTFFSECNASNIEAFVQEKVQNPALARQVWATLESDDARTFVMSKTQSALAGLEVDVLGANKVQNTALYQERGDFIDAGTRIYEQLHLSGQNADPLVLRNELAKFMTY